MRYVKVYLSTKRRSCLPRCVRGDRHGERGALSSARDGGRARQNELIQHTTTIYLHPNIAEYARGARGENAG